MPIHHVKGGYKWGNHGHVYKTRAGAVKQAQAAYAHGYREKGGHSKAHGEAMKGHKGK